MVYSSRKEHLIKPLFDAFEKETAIKITYQTGSEGPLIERLKQEGKGTPADILLLVDASHLQIEVGDPITFSINMANLVVF